MSFKKESILFSKNISSYLKNSPLVICDIGGRGKLVKPQFSFQKSNDALIQILSFEPDKKEYLRLSSLNNKIKYFPYALWNKEGEMELNLTTSPSSSSIHPPNYEEIDQFEKKHHERRHIEKKVKVPTITLDKVLQENNLHADFLKIDTQGSEFEILEGATQTLEKDCFGCTLETWTTGIHKNQYLSFDIMKFMHEHDFLFFDFEIGASWKRKIKNNDSIKSKRQIVGLDFLYLKNPKSFLSTNPSIEKIIKAICIADVWGFSDYSLQLIENYDADSDILISLKHEILKRRSKSLIKNPHINRIIDEIKTRFLKIEPSYPRIH